MSGAYSRSDMQGPAARLGRYVMPGRMRNDHASLVSCSESSERRALRAGSRDPGGRGAGTGANTSRRYRPAAEPAR